MSWYEQNFEAVDKIPDLKKQNRFWLKAGEERKVIFLDKDPFTFWEHQVKLNNDYRNYFTCLQNMNQPCPLCKAGIKRYFVGLFSVIELSEWTDKDGKLHKNPVKIMAIKQKALKVLKRHSDKNRVLNGLFTVIRTDDKSGSSGDMFEFEKTVNPLEFNPQAQLIAFEKECAPVEADKLRMIGGMAEADGFGSTAAPGTSSPVETDDVPF
jgi:hypothetical protein